MNIIFTCPHCDQKIEAPKIYAGTEILCPTCQNAIICPEPEAQKMTTLPIKKTSVQISSSSKSSQKTNKEPAPFNEVVYTLLGIFFGLFGAHNLYKKQYIAGLLRGISIFFVITILFEKVDIAIAAIILGISQLLIIFELGLQREYPNK